MDGLICYFSGRDLREQNDHVETYHSHLQDYAPPWLKTVIPSYDSLLLVFNPYEIDNHGVYRYLKEVKAGGTKLRTAKHHEIPVWYGAPSANDLHLISAHTGLSHEDIIQQHTATRFKVFAVGFAPGFAYLGENPPSLSIPRLATPRSKVPAGAVAIADRQSAIYPHVSPGGWHLLGLCPLTLFDISETPSGYLQMGDTLSFYSIKEDDYRRWHGGF
ncbi:allophanate hydrolase subunit 1 [Aestuariibacter sp. A3R04]|nr:allophanate hydrolase subunit 1 [Aestuariibacter sp. A3R04]